MEPAMPDYSVKPRRLASSLRSALPIACAIFASACGLTGSAHAQVLSLGCEVAQALTLDEGQRKSLKDYASANLEKLAAPETARNGRESLLSPLTGCKPSAAFRLEYSQATIAKLSQMVTGVITGADAPAEDAAINALVIVGELGTIDGLNVSLAALKAKSAPVRLQAAYAIRRTVEGLQQGAAGVQCAELERACDALRDALKAEGDSYVVQQFAETLTTAGASTACSLSDPAFAGLARGLGGRPDLSGNAGLNGAALGTMEWSLRTLRGRLAAGGKANPATLKTVAEMAGQALAHTMRVANAQNLPATEDGRKQYSRMCLEAEALIKVCGNALNPNIKFTDVQAGNAILLGTNKGDADFSLKAGQIIDNVLTKAPFELQAGAFKK